MKTEDIVALEKEWIKNFTKSVMVIDGKFNADIAKSIFYGKSKNIKNQIDVGYKLFYGANLHTHNLESIVNVVEFLKIIGITISKNQLYYAVQCKRMNYNELYRRVYFIFLTLVNSTSNLDINNPYADNQGDIYFLLKAVVDYNRGFALLYRMRSKIFKK